MTFEELLNLALSPESPAVRIDSRLVEPGDIFVAVPGTVCDGHDFIGQALQNGAGYIVRQADRPRPGYEGPCETIVVPDSARAAGILAQAAAGEPASRLTNLAVTGTNGKTTVAFLVRSIIERAGRKCGLIGTVTYDTCGGRVYESALTTPDCLAIAEMTAEMVRNHAEYMVIEASSHALTQGRLAGLTFKAAAFTNLSGDHLDYHKTEQDYLAAKARLFEGLTGDAVAILNAQSAHAKRIAERTQARILWYAVDEPAELSAQIESMDTGGSSFRLEYAGRGLQVKLPLLGLYNLSNALAAAGLCLAAGFEPEAVAEGLAAVRPIPGRLERVDWPGDFTVLVDYAHTDDALKNVLATLKPLCAGKLAVVFGCGGDRDRTKRPRMAAVAEELADLVIVTSDNPRTEDPRAIISEIATGFQEPPGRGAAGDGQHPQGPTILIEPDRAKAIRLAIDAAGPGDIVLIAGKGHETYQIVGRQKRHFSDKETVLECLKELV